MSHPGPEHQKEMQHMLGYLKGKNTEGIIIRKPKIIKSIMFFSKYSTDKETRKSVRGIVATLGDTLLTCSSKTQRAVTLRSTDAEHVGLSE